MATDTPTADESETTGGRDYRDTLFLPETDFPMRAGLPQREPDWLARWQQMDLYNRQRAQAKEQGRETFILHDGPPYANGEIHIGHALNKTLKDIVVRSQEMMGKDAVYVPGWDCHGLPIEWKIEEKYRARGKNKDEVPPLEFRKECRDFAAHWIEVQKAEFIRLGVNGDWAHPYTTMAFDAEAAIVAEFQKFVMNGALYRGSKPVMWSVVERTALAEAEVEYAEHKSPTIWVRFAVTEGPAALSDASIVVWTTTPWTIPGNRAIAYSETIPYGLYQVDEVAEGSLARPGETIVLADALAENVRESAKIDSWTRLADVSADDLSDVTCRHPYAGLDGTGDYFSFGVPLIPGDHVTDEAGTGFVHTAPGHGQDDYLVYLGHKKRFADCGTREIPQTIDEAGSYYDHVPLFAGKRVLDDKGKDGDANGFNIKTLIESGALLAKGSLRHSYPHSWRSKTPLIFRNTPQWFVSMDWETPAGKSLRDNALDEIARVGFVPATGRNRIHAMVEGRPDWVVSRQRAWGVPLTLFVHKETGEILRDDAVNARIHEAVLAEGADAWFEKDAGFFLGNDYTAADYEKVTDILDVWFDSGSTHAFVLEARPDLRSPADLYLEGSDQHRGWFQSSLLESCVTRGRAPYNQVLTHGFTLNDKGEKMSKSAGNSMAPQTIIKQYGADILRLWVANTDYWEDQRIGEQIIKTNVESYRKLRNTLRFLIGNLSGFREEERLPFEEMPELERYMLHRIHELDRLVRDAYLAYDFKRVAHALTNFMIVDLSAFYFDIRKDSLYCDPESYTRRRACRTVLDHLFMCLTAWLAPVLCFTMEEVWLSRFPEDDGSVHLRTFPDVPAGWADADLAAKWNRVRDVRRVVTGALEVERREKRIGASLEAAPEVYIANDELRAALGGVDLAEIFITSDARLIAETPPSDAFTLQDVEGVGVVPRLAEGKKCARSWKIQKDVGSVPGYPDLTPRDAEAVKAFDAAHGVPA